MSRYEEDGGSGVPKAGHRPSLLEMWAAPKGGYRGKGDGYHPNPFIDELSPWQRIAKLLADKDGVIGK